MRQGKVLNLKIDVLFQEYDFLFYLFFFPFFVKERKIEATQILFLLRSDELMEM